MEEIVEPGELKPSEIHVPGIFVQRVVKEGPHQKRIEKLTLSGETSKESAIDPVREKIIKRAARELEVCVCVFLWYCIHAAFTECGVAACFDG